MGKCGIIESHMYMLVDLHVIEGILIILWRKWRAS